MKGKILKNKLYIIVFIFFLINLNSCAITKYTVPLNTLDSIDPSKKYEIIYHELLEREKELSNIDSINLNAFDLLSEIKFTLGKLSNTKDNNDTKTLKNISNKIREIGLFCEVTFITIPEDSLVKYKPISDTASITADEGINLLRTGIYNIWIEYKGKAKTPINDQYNIIKKKVTIKLFDDLDE